MIAKTYTAIHACTSEIKIYLGVFFLPVFTIAGLIFPALSLYWIVYTFIAIGVEANLFHKAARDFILANLGSFILLTVPLLLILYGCLLSYLFTINRPADADARKTKALPDTEKGIILSSAVIHLWNTFGNTKRPTPQVVWFINFNVLARAIDVGGVSQIQVSSGLWDRFVKNDSIGKIILAHEIAHLAHRDLPTFKLLENVVLAVRKLVSWLSYAALAAALWAIGYELMADITRHQSFKVGLIHVAGAPVVAAFVLFPLWLGNWVVRRYCGFITSLMELRADVTAAEWTENFSRALGQDATVHKNSLRELGQSLISLNLTHIAETERLAILNSVDRLTTPKIRYYALSILLALVLPLNSFTPMLWNGAMDHFFIASVVVALHIATFTMIVQAPLHRVISWKRSATLATILVIANGLATINVYQLGYYFTEVGASFFAPNGFADKLLSWPELYHDGGVSLRGMGKEFIDSYGAWALIPAIGLSVVLVHLSSVFASGIRLSNFYKILILVLAGYAAIIACYDPQRNEWYNNFLLSPASKLDEFFGTQALRFILPVLTITVLLACVRLVASTDFRSQSAQNELA